MAAFAGKVGQPSKPDQVARGEEGNAVVERKPLARLDLLFDRSELRSLRGFRARGQGMAGLVTGWNGCCDSGETSSTKGWMYR